MATTVATPPARTGGSRVKGRNNYLGGLIGWIWLAVIIVPIYYVVVTSFKNQGAYFTSNPLALPLPPTFDAYNDVVEAGIGRYFLNSVIVTIGTVIPVVIFGFLASYGIVRGGAGSSGSTERFSCSAWPSPCRRPSSRST